MEELPDNVVYSVFNGSWCIRVPVNSSYKKGDTVDVYVSIDRTDYDQVLGPYVDVNEYGRYYLMMESD